MSKRKKKKTLKSDKFTVMTSYEATMASKPYYNGYATGHGPHGKSGYDRTTEKRNFRKELDQSGSFDIQRKINGMMIL